MADKQKKPTVDGASTPADSQPSDTDKTPLINEDTTDISSEPTSPSLFGKIQDAHKSSASSLAFLQALFVILAGTIGCTITIGLVVLVPVAMIVIGAVYKDDCPFQNMIPIYLIVGGTVGVFRLSLAFCNRITTSGEEEGGKGWLTAVLVTLDFFSFIWFVCGNVWVFGKDYKPRVNTGIHDDRYCDKTVYLFAFWLITVAYIVIAVMFVALCCAAMSAAIIPVARIPAAKSSE